MAADLLHGAEKDHPSDGSQQRNEQLSNAAARANTIKAKRR